MHWCSLVQFPTFHDPQELPRVTPEHPWVCLARYRKSKASFHFDSVPIHLFFFLSNFFIFYPFHFLFDFNFFFFFGKEATDGSIFVWVFILRNADGRFCWIQKSRLECFIQYLNILSYFPRGSLLCLLRLFHPR